MAQPPYKTVSLVFTNKGLVARYAEDRAPDPSQYLNLDNLECRQENALSSRYGLQSITNDGTVSKPLAAGVHTLGRLKSLGLVQDRLAGAGTKVYARSGNSNGAYTDITGSVALSGNPWSQVVYEPVQSALPYVYIFDSAVNLKWYHGAAAALQNGINPPTILPSLKIAAGIEQITIIDTFYATSVSRVTSGFTAHSFASRVNTTLMIAITTQGLQSLPLTSTTGVVAQEILDINNGGGNTENVLVGTGAGSTTAFFQNLHASLETVQNNYLSGSIAPTTTAYAGEYLSTFPNFDLSSIGSPRITMAPTDVFTLGFYVDVPANIASVSIAFAIVGTIGSFADYYGASFDISALGVGWNYLTVPRSAFTANGNAGQPGATWANISAYQITVVTNGSGGVNVGLDDLYVSIGSQLTVTGGVSYDYRFTYYNANTGTESNPSVVMVPAAEVSPVNQSVAIFFSDTPPSEATHRRLYREGGSLDGAWWMVEQIPVAQTAYLDSWPDSQIVNNPEVSLTNDPPVTSALVTPINVTLSGSVFGGVNTASVTPSTKIVAGQLLTIDTGNSQEQVYVITGGTSSFQANFQIFHNAGATVTATTAPAVGLNLACVAFNIVWGAGDANNPSTLYYSNTNNPEGWSSANTLLLGPPSDPITAITYYRGQLYVFTLSTVYQILPQGTSPPIPIITGSVHGSTANFGIAQAEGELIYQSIDGIYAFSGAAQLLSEIIDWIITGKTLGPVVPMKPGLGDNVKAAFVGNEIAFSYTGTDGNLHRIWWHTVYKRWRNDDVPALSMYYEQDTGYLIVGEANGNIYHDRVGDYDDGGWTGGVETKTSIQINLTTQLQDFGNIKADKYFQELSLDVDTAGQNLTVTFYYDNLGSTFTDTFTVNTASRQQVNFNVNNGLGYRARRLGMKITGGVTSAVTLYQWDIRVMLDAEARQSFDSGQLDFGTSEFKLTKQAYFEYQASNGPVTVNCYTEGTDTVQFSFVLPQTGTISDAATNTLGKQSVKVRFPAIKARIFRFVGTCAGDFKLYESSFYEVKPITDQKGYRKIPMTQTAPV